MYLVYHVYMNNTSDDETSNSKKHYAITTSIFWIFTGIFLLINNFYLLDTKIVLFLLLFASIYLVVCSSLKLMRRIYFIFGLLIFSIFLNLLFSQSSTPHFLWSLVILIMGIGVIGYGYLFKRKYFIRYLIPGVIILFIAVLSWISVVGSFKLSEFLLKLWPLLVVFWGGHTIYLKFHHSRVTSEKGKIDPQAKEEVSEENTSSEDGSKNKTEETTDSKKT